MTNRNTQPEEGVFDSALANQRPVSETFFIDFSADETIAQNLHQSDEAVQHRIRQFMENANSPTQFLFDFQTYGNDCDEEVILSEGVRKGRSRQIAFTIAVQSAAQIPDDILNNLNTRIIHRHNRASEAQRALEKAADAQISMTKNFGPGEALVDLFGASAVVSARMRLSPFQLVVVLILLIIMSYIFRNKERESFLKTYAPCSNSSMA